MEAVMKTISIETQDTVGVIKLENGITNTISQHMVDELHAAIKSIQPDPNVKGIVLSSSNEKFFSIGFDIPNLYDLIPKEFEHFYDTFNKFALDLFTLPKPTLAAIPGHAIAGGCILALCCDYRMIAEGRKLMGLNEIKLGVPVPYTVDCILRDLIGTQRGRDVLELGEFYPSEDLLRLGMVDQVMTQDELLPASIEKIKTLGEMPDRAYAIIKDNRTKPVKAQILAEYEMKKGQFIECWYSPEGRAFLKEAMAKF